MADASPFASAEATIAAQDAVELALWALADANGYLPPKKSKQQVGFHELLHCVPSAAPHIKALEQLNASRVQAKHYGSGPDRDETLRQIARADEAIREISTKESPHLNVACAFLGSGLRNCLVASELEAAEQLIDRDDRRNEFARCLARARHFALQQARAALRIESWPRRVRHDPYYGKERELFNAIEKLSEHAREAISNVEERLAEHVLIADRADEILLDRLLPRVWRYGDGRLETGDTNPTNVSLTVARRTALLLATVRAAEQAEELDAVVSALDSDMEAKQHLEVLRPCDAVVPFGPDDTRVLAHLRPGDRCVSRGIAMGAERNLLWVRVFGVDATVPADAFEPDLQRA